MPVGGLGGARCGTRLPNGGDMAGTGDGAGIAAGAPRGTGGGERGFSKLPS